MRFNPGRLREARQALTEHGRPVSQERFAELLGVSRRSVERWETGSTPRERQMTAIARVTGRPEGFFFVGAGTLTQSDREVVAVALEEFKLLLDQAFTAALDGVRKQAGRVVA